MEAEAEGGAVVLPGGGVVVEGLHLCLLRSLQKKENQNMFHLTRQFIIVCIEPFMYLQFLFLRLCPFGVLLLQRLMDSLSRLES